MSVYKETFAYILKIFFRTRKLFKLRGFDDYTRTHIQVSQLARERASHKNTIEVAYDD